MKWPRTWLEVFDPQATQKLDVSRIVSDLNNPQVRAHWLRAVLDQLRAINLEVDKLLDKGPITERLIEISAKRRQIVAVLEQIEASRNSVELENNHNQDDLLAV